jgi:ABC-type multidrug transport system fused ATPase/permease subunit
MGGLWQVLSHRLAMRLRREGFAYLMTRDAAFFDRARDGDLVLRAGKDVDLLQRTTVKLLGRWGASYHPCPACCGSCVSESGLLYQMHNG